MGTELHISFRGPEGAADASRALMALSKLTQLLDVLDRARGPGFGRTTWAMSELERGSVVTTLVPARPRPGLTEADANDELRQLYEGFAHAQQRDGAPAHWPRRAIVLGAEIGELLGLTEDQGMTLQLSNGVATPRKIAVTRTTGERLRASLRSRQTSIGSLVGHLLGINTYNRNTARLWLTHPRASVEVLFADDDFEDVRTALRRRVMVAGKLERSPTGHPLRLHLRSGSLEVLPGMDESPPLATYAGRDPDFTGGVDPVEYVRDLRDSA